MPFVKQSACATDGESRDSCEACICWSVPAHAEGLVLVNVISRFRASNGLEPEVRGSVLSRRHLAEEAPGFHGLDILTDASDASVFLLLTRWADEESFHSWQRGTANRGAADQGLKALIPQGVELDDSFTTHSIGTSLEVSAVAFDLNDAIEGESVSFARWLMESDAVFALLLTADGTIRLRNRGSCRIFPPDSARNFGACIWEYLLHSDAEKLRARLADPKVRFDGNLLINLTDAQQNPITLEVALIRCNGSILLVATEESRHNALMKSEIFKLTNDLSMTARESVRKNRELIAANEIIERLARTDPLTGLANRRTLDEVLSREIARTERLGGGLSVIMADLDRFKSINDQYGHTVGDKVLAGAAAVFGSQLRAYDLAARYGGEEFILLISGATAEQATVIAERIRKQVESLEIAECSRQITISSGVASWVMGEQPGELVARADAALYMAKKKGRNRVEIADGPACVRPSGKDDAK